MYGVKKRIGLALASIHTGASLSVCPCFIKTAAAENVSLFIFPGGRLNALSDSENLRNPVYSLINKENLDGFVSWSSSIHYTEQREEFDLFHTRFDPVPYVTLVYKSPGHPCVAFNAYKGMKALVSHFITVHHARKIAFLRGPDFHPSALERYHGYLDALKEAGLGCGASNTGGAMRERVAGKTAPAVEKGSLISDPFNWDSGNLAAAQLFEKRGLIPGRDFDTLIGSSDMMVFDAVNYFAGQGYHIPADYHAGGFNNSGESKLLESPLTTVHMPYEELCNESFRILLKLLEKKGPDDTTGDLTLDMDIVVRESCGCGNLYMPVNVQAGMPPADLCGGNKGHEDKYLKAALGAKNREELTAALSKWIAGELKLDGADINAWVLPLIHALYVKDLKGEAGFFNLFEKALIRFFYEKRDLEALVRLAGRLFNSGLIPAEKLLHTGPAIYGTIFRIQERLSGQIQIEKENRHAALNSLKCELLGTRDRNALILSLARHLPRIGITFAAIVLYADENISTCVGSFSLKGISPLREQRFPASRLLPASLDDEVSGGSYMVQPLFIENQSLGYFVHTVPMFDGLIFEELRSAVSYALKGIALLEEVIREKKIAEQAERAKTEFLKIVENELYDPLAGLMEKIENIEREIERGQTAVDGQRAAHDQRIIDGIAEIKAFIAKREAETGSLIDLTLARINEPYLNRQLFDLEDILPGAGSFPLLLGDTLKLAECFSLIREEFSGAVSAELEYGGIAVNFSKGKTAAGRKHGMLLAERIILLHNGTFKCSDDSCAVLLPWTTLSGRDAVKRVIGPEDRILALSDPALVPANFFRLPLVCDPDQAVPGKTACIVWNDADFPDRSSTGDSAVSGGNLQVPRGNLVTISAFNRRSEFAGLPFLFYGKGFSGNSIIEAVENKMRSSRKRNILYIGLMEEKVWPDAGEEIRIHSMGKFNETVAEISPSLIVFYSLNIESLIMVRNHPITVAVPVIMIPEEIESPADVLALSKYSRLIICHRSAAESPEFAKRVKAIVSGDEMLPPHTGALVKKALLYFNQYAHSHISRWKLAEAVNVSEDYLTRIFRREMGISLWDYLNRCRIHIAAGLLQRTDESIAEIALKSGFQDQAYFCRVFKKIYGIPPGHLRKGK
ncbi:MAG: helix-turn-helix domain-containing protein [Treponema sp.]|jgi:DNA-binding LacI/PurR family transcriptional regulator/AraC-like DNA-binding protein|nr:helix-turn-helix domain-containing protein [Treponema sp.]